MNKKDMGVALVTGASSGIGKVTTQALVRAGYRVFGTSRKPETHSHQGVTMLVCDVTDDASVQNMVAQIIQSAGRIDLLVNNAGIGLLAAAEESTTAQAQALFNVNLFGITRVTNAVLPTMRKQQSGRIINISSILGLIPAPYSALYSSSKHAVEGYSESLDHELRTLGIRVVVVEPGVTRTAFDSNITRPDQPLAIYEKIRTRQAAVMHEWLKTGDEPEIVAETVVKAATAKAPKRRYTAGKQATQVRFLRRFMPECLVDRSLRKFNQLPI